MDSPLVIGLDVGGTRILAGLVDRGRNVHLERTNVGGGFGEAAGELLLAPAGRAPRVAGVPSSRATPADCPAPASGPGAAQVAFGALDGER